jgi:hypothetical protein
MVARETMLHKKCVIEKMVGKALSHLASKGSLAVLDWLANPLTLLKPAPAKG